jgi:hypothetical protein
MKRKFTDKKPKIKLSARKPSKIKAVLKAWGDSSDRVDADPLQLDGAPVWVENAFMEVAKVVLPGQRLLASGDCDLEPFGELLGRMQAFGKLYAGEIPMGPEVKQEYDRLLKKVAGQPQTPERIARAKRLVKDMKARTAATEDAIPQMMSAALASSHEDALKFQKGLMRGMSLAPDDLATGKVFQRHTRTFWTLAVMWPIFSKCRSVAEVHRILCKAVGEQKAGSLKTFENRVAKKIGMKFGRSGRPPKQK